MRAMRHLYTQLTFTDSVRRAQRRYGAERPAAATRDHGSGLGAREIDFIAARDSFYLATVSDTGWPYVQHRGGPAGFLRVLGPTTLAFADYRGNRQYLSVGNLDHDDRMALILMDYPNRRRLKLLGHARAVDTALAPADVSIDAERVMLIEVVAFDWNCALHITPRYTEAELDPVLRPFRARITELESLLRRAGIPLPAARPSIDEENTR